MYIPTSFFSSQGSCFTITTSAITGSGNITSGSFISGGYVWDYYSFNNTSNQYATSASFSASFNVLSGSTGQAKILIVAGGGGGGFNPGDSCINPYIDTLGSAGGGGGGGVVYYNQFPLSSGSYEVVVGTGGLGAGDYPGRIGATGGRSYFKNKDFDYSPFTSSFLVAYGGGGGAGCTNNCAGGGIGIGDSGASSGGGAQTSIANTAVPQVQPLNVFGGVPAVIQGNRSGAITGNPYGNDRAMGGGGAGTSSADITDTYNPGAGSPGGSGIPYNVTGTLTYYGAGGGGVRWAGTGGGTLTGNGTGWGNPGSGGTGGFGARFSTPRGATPGENGVVIIAIQKCLSAFSCKNFAITGSNTTLSYLNCGFPFVTSSKLSSNQDEFTACLLTYSGSNTPVLLTGTTTSTVISDCSAQLTSSAGCNCTYIRAVPNSGTQTINLFPCNGSGSVTQSVPPAGKFFCIENGSNYSFPSGAVTEYGSCITGSCTGISYTSSFVNCSSYTATAGGNGATFIYLPCGSSSASIINLSGSESRSVCAAYTASFGLLTGAGSSYSNFGTCSYQFPPSIVSWSFDEINQNGTFTITNGPTTIVTLTADGSGSTAISGSKQLDATLSPVAYAGTSGSLFMNLNISGSNVNINRISNINNTISASVLMDYGQTYFVSASIRWDAFPAITSSLWSYIDISNNTSYNGSGSTIQDLTSNNNDARILSSSYWIYDSSSLTTPVLRLNAPSSDSSSVEFSNITSANSFTLLLSWYGVNPVYDGFYDDVALLFDKDQDPGNNQFGMVVSSSAEIAAVVVSNSFRGSTKVSGSGNTNQWHISQITLTNTGTGSYCVDGITGSYTGTIGGGGFSNIVYSIFGNKLTGASSGFTTGSMFQVACIYTGSLTQQQMLDNYNALKNRYGL